jgi:hypothetical protein
MRYAVDLRHPLQAPCGGDVGLSRHEERSQLVAEAVGMWESQRDFQRVWEGWEAGFMAFHAFHTLSFPWSAFRWVSLDKLRAAQRSAPHLLNPATNPKRSSRSSCASVASRFVSATARIVFCEWASLLARRYVLLIPEILDS